MEAYSTIIRLLSNYQRDIDIGIVDAQSPSTSRKCRGSKTPCAGGPSASCKDVWGQYAWVVAPARTTDRCSLQRGAQPS